MLSESDKKWLKDRKPPTKQPYKTTADDNFCRYCARYNTHCTPWFRDVAYCPTDKGGDFNDAAEHEARVAAIMPYIVFRVVSEQAEQKEITIDAWTCLKLARLAVEAEMEAESAGR